MWGGPDGGRGQAGSSDRRGVAAPSPRPRRHTPLAAGRGRGQVWEGDGQMRGKSQMGREGSDEREKVRWDGKVRDERGGGG